MSQRHCGVGQLRPSQHAEPSTQVGPHQTVTHAEPGTRWGHIKPSPWGQIRLSEPALGVEALYTDFYGQSGQLFHEVERTRRHGDADGMLDLIHTRRYGARLVDWWSEWSVASLSSPECQKADHELLARELASIREGVGAPLSESLKLEAWVRWHPEAMRELALWASSVGSWVDPWAMRRDSISVESPFRAVQAFCVGAPVFLEGAEGARWRSYLATPVWADSDVGDLPLGVVTIASLLDPDQGSISPRRLERLDYALVRMRAVGRQILDPKRGRLNGLSESVVKVTTDG